MDRKLIKFNLCKSVESLITTLELKMGTEITLKEMNFPAHDTTASARGGFDNWNPFVGINISMLNSFDEHALSHEVLHVKRFFEGAYILETPDRVQGKNDTDAQKRIRFVDDVTNQIEHIAIFPELVSYGFDPHKLADDWKKRQINELSSPPAKWGPVDHSWACIKIGIAEHIGLDKNLNTAYKNCFQKVDCNVVKKGENIAECISRWGLKKQYNMKRLYEQMLKLADIPKNNLYLKQFDFRCKREQLEKI